MTRARKHERISDEQHGHLLIKLPADETATVMLVLVEKFGFTEDPVGNLVRADGSRVTLL